MLKVTANFTTSVIESHTYYERITRIHNGMAKQHMLHTKF